VASVGAASPPQDVQIEADIEFVGGVGSASGPFVATGAAVDDGLICSSGNAVSVSSKVSGGEGNTGFNVQVIYLFTCDDFSGEFYIKLQVRIDHNGDNFNWNIVGGTGEYEKLHGTGSGIGIPGVPCGDLEECVLDIYDGKVHID
jgi:hypothetical protein